MAVYPELMEIYFIDPFFGDTFLLIDQLEI